MLTDAPPRKANRAGFLESDQTRTLDLPQDGSLLTITKSIESAMRRGRSTDVRRTCAEFLDAASQFYKVPACGFRVLAARPLRVRERWTTELLHDRSKHPVLSPNGRHGAFVLGAVCEETSIALEVLATNGQLDLRRLLNVANPLAVYVRGAEVKPVSIQNEPDRNFVQLPGLAPIMGQAAWSASRRPASVAQVRSIP